MQMVRSHALATAAGDVTVAAPSATSGGSFFGSISCTTSEKPAFARLSAIGPPILPSPMNPTLPGIVSPPVAVGLDFTGADLACRLDDGYCGGARRFPRGSYVRTSSDPAT